MNLTPYRRVLALPGVRALMLVALVARIPVMASGIAMTLHVVFDLGGSYAAAGVVGATFTVSSAVGAPLLGRLVDRTSLRTALLICVASDALFWAVAPLLPYAALVVAACVVGVLTLPVFSIVRQSIAALVPEAQRRQAYALDSMALEVSFMAGPSLAVLLVTQVSAMFAMYAVGTAIVLAGIGMYVLNPPTRSAHEAKTGIERVPRRSWLRPRFVALLAASAAATLVLAGTNLALVATLNASGEVAWIGAILAAWGVYSLIGGFVHGAVRRGLPMVVLLGLLSLFTIPVGVAETAGWLMLVLIPCGALCAPSLASSADEVSRLVPAAARGEAMGLHNSSMTVGLAAGAPLAGAVMDMHGPAWGYVLVGGLGLVVAVALLPILARRTPTPTEPAEPAEAAGPAVGAAKDAGPVGAAGVPAR